MSLLLDALKKAALEKQRRAQDVVVGPAPAEGESAQPKPASAARGQGANLLPIWAKQKQKAASLGDDFASAFTDSPADKPVAQNLPTEAVLPAQNSAAIKQQDKERLVDLTLVAKPFDDDTATDFNLDTAADLAPQNGEDTAANCSFIDISDLDFGSLVGFVEKPPEPAAIVEPQTLSLLQPLPQEGVDAEPDSVENDAALLVPAVGSLDGSAPESASQIEHIEQASHHPIAPLESVAPVVASPEAQSAESSPTAPNNADTAVPASNSSPTKHTQQAAKHALNELLHNSQKAANRSRKRLLRMYGLLVVTAGSLVGVYYFLLHQGAAPMLATPVQMGPVQVGPVTSPVAAVSQPVTQPPQTEQEAGAGEHKEPVPAVDASSTKAEQILAAAAPVEDTSKASGLVHDPHSANTQTAQSQTVARDRATIAITLPVTSEPAAEEAMPDGYKGEVMVPVDVPIRTPTTTVLAYQPAAVDDLATAVEAGFTAYEAGDMAAAAEAYQSALKIDPYQRDALLGAASVAVQQGRPNDALTYYQQRLARAPKDDFALAGVLALGAQGETNPQLDAQLSRLLLAYPQAAHLHYLQGTLYAQRQQWGAAQLALLAAWQLDNHNPDIACNLAIAFDHLQQPEEAARFYRQALSLAQGQAVGFTLSAIRTRLAELDGAQPKERRR